MTVTFIHFNESIYSNIHNAEKNVAIKSPSYYLSAWDMNYSSASELGELVELAQMYMFYSCPSERFGFYQDGRFIPVDIICKFSKLIMNGNISITDLFENSAYIESASAKEKSSLSAA